MKRLLIIGMALWAAVHLSAGIRTAADALRIAEDFMETSVPRASRIPRAPSSPSSAGPMIADSSAIYLAVNTSPGYVLVGADERLPQVLAYSDTVAFDPENISPEFQYWMTCYEEELNQIQQRTGLSAKRSISASGLTAIPPLCPSQWNQSAPYNKFAPMYNDKGGQCVTGCVATAMAQIMFTHRYPQYGTGSHSYLWVCTNPVGATATLSADFGQTVYQWENMLPSYKSGYTLAQADAVATLMYHCGVAVNMGYGQSSGAYTAEVPLALKTYFGYDANYQRIQKVMYAPDSLAAIVRAELNAKRPVLISGSNDEGGHAFVCDGCDNKGFFHINWGWGGSNDGYFLLTALNPGSKQGIGGTTQGYNKGTTFFIGLQPAAAASPKPIPQLAARQLSVSDESFSRTKAFSASVERLENFGLDDFSGAYGIALYDEDESHLIALLAQNSSYSLKAGYHRTTLATFDNLKIPASLPEGTYHLSFVYRNANYDWMRMLMTQDDYFRTLEVTPSTVTFYPNDAPAELSLEAPIAFPDGTNNDSVPMTGLPLSFIVKNTGGTFRGEISARIYKGAFSKGQYEVMDEVVIRRSQSLASALQENFDANLLLDTQYKMRLCWRADANDAWHNFEPAEYAELPFKLYDPDYHLSLTDTIHFDNNDSVPRTHANLYYSIKNTGAVFHGQLQVSFYEGPFSRGKSSLQEITVGTGETLSGAFSGPLEQLPGTYEVILRYREKEGDWMDFTDVIGNNLGDIFATVYEDTPTDLEEVNHQFEIINRKYIQSGHLFIERDGKTYNVLGIMLKK